MFTKCSGYKLPFVHHTALGWVLVVSTCKSVANNESCLKTCTTEHFSALSCFKQDVSCLHLNKWSLPDYNVFEVKLKGDDELLALSKNDEKFLPTVYNWLHTNNEGNIVMPVSFKDSNVTLPHNKSEVNRRIKSTLCHIANEPKELIACVWAMQKYIDAGHVEQVALDEETHKRFGKAWWIPIFPVTHPTK